MSAVHPPSSTEAPPTAGPPRNWWRGRSGLVLALVMVAFSTYLLYGVLTMAPTDNADIVGPAFYPTILLVLGYVLAALLILAYVRRPEPVERDAHTTYSDWAALAWCVGGFAVFAALLNVLGWILAAAVLFWCVARGIGSKRPLFDITLALLVSSIVYLAFAVLLGLNLPSGVLGGL
ncbi:tripartite tricarboxylate transporter TctB family protein [Georgenia deserti]|uniref:Tripartite tricarboxylate transporter TctB family protein n=1 Tax=Georgenia deserti TaxID=2093781 RepID=A0ABW4L579_9MICO